MAEEDEDNDMLIISTPSISDDNEHDTHDIWEFVNRSDADDSDSDSVITIENGFISLLSSTQPQLAHQHSQNPNPDFDPLLDLDVAAAAVGGDDVYGHGDDVEERVVDDDDEEEDGYGYGYGYGLDDELVPWHVSGKLGRERMRKLGKRGFAKMGSSKRNPYLYVKPGCVHGKHGLGIKAGF